MAEKISADLVAEKYYQDIYKFCCARCRDANVAQDITQETFLLLVNNKERLANINIRSWLLSVANNKLHEHFRKICIESSFVCIDDVEIPFYDDYEYIDEDTDSNFDEVQQKILNILNEKEKELFKKLYIEKKSVSLIVKELDITEGNFRVRKSRLKNKIKRSIDHLYFFLSVSLFKVFYCLLLLEEYKK